MKKTPRIFISYARADFDQAKALYAKLKQAGFAPWLDQKDLVPGEAWKLAIRRAVQNADIFIACLSLNSVNRRGMIQREIKQALDLWEEKLGTDIFVIPVRLEECDAPEELAPFQWVDWFDKKNGWNRLKAAVEKQMENLEEDARGVKAKPMGKRKAQSAKHTQLGLHKSSPAKQVRIAKPHSPIQLANQAQAPSLRTREIIGRTEELAAIKQAIQDTDQHVLMFVGPGGIGKTRLLQQVGEILSKWKGKKPRWSGIIDVYHPEAHSDLGMQEQIIEGIDPTHQYFQKYLDQAQTYRAHLAEGFGGKALEREREEIEKLFLTSYRKLADQYRVVLTIDTLELIEYEDEIVQSLCEIETETTTLKNWLLTKIPQLPNTVTILGGRPQKQRLSAGAQPELQDTKVWGELEAGFEHAKIFSRRADKFELKDFTEEEARAYFEDWIKQPLRLSGNISEQDLQLIFARTERRPIRLSLVFHLVADGQENILPKLLSPVSSGNLNVDEELVEMLQSPRNWWSDVLLYLAATRKGLNAKLMHFLDPSKSESEWADKLERMKDFTFVKSRPRADLIFLHDELYQIFELKSDLSKREEARPRYNRIAEYYRRQQAELEQKLLEFQETESEARESCRQERQAAMLAQLHYELQMDPRKGFQEFFIRWDDEAIEGHEIDFDNRLRDELWRFLTSPVTQIKKVLEKIDLEEINRDSAVRWVRRYLSREKFDKARRVAGQILNSPHPLFAVEDPLFKGDLYCAYGEALLYLNAPSDETANALHQATGLLESENALTMRAPWRRDRILGRAHNNLGYHWQIGGRAEKTLEAYQHAIRHQEGIPIEKANTLNNMAYALANLGRMEFAQDNIEEAIRIRKEMGLVYLLALSYNVQGYIYVLSDHTSWGQDACAQALDLFRKMGDRRGIGLALNGLGFACRKRADQWKLKGREIPEADLHFAQAEQYFQEAQQIFSSEINEPFEKWRAFSELGSTYCDWGFLLSATQKPSQAAEKWELAVQNQEVALKIARASKLTLQEIDSLDDLAQVCQDKGDLDQASHWLEQIAPLISKEYWLVKDIGFPDLPEPNEGYWLALSKYHLQLGIWAFHDCLKLPESDRDQCLPTAVTNFALASAYAEKYWGRSYALSLTLRSFAKHLREMGPHWADQVRRVIRATAQEYNIHLDPILETVDNTLGK